MSEPVILNYLPRKWQLTCHLNKKRFSVLAVHRRAGKSQAAIMELVNGALSCKLELPLFVYVAPFLSQAKAIAWIRIKDVLKPLIEKNAVLIHEAELSITFKHNQARIRLFGGDNPHAIRGVRLDGCVIDEVAQIKPEVWTEIIQPALSDRKGWAIFIGTPSGTNLFSKLYAEANGKQDWYAAKFTVFDTDSLDVEEVARLQRDMSEKSFAREFLCDFSAAGDDQLISVSEAELAAQRTYQHAEYCNAPIVLGVDPARFGDDRSVIVRRQGLKCFEPLVFNGIDNMDLASRVASQIIEHNPASVFIDAGAGSGVIDRLRQLGFDVIEVNFGGKPTNEKLYKNKRAEIWFAVKEWLNQGGSIPNDMSLKEELSTPVYWYDQVGKRVLEPKDAIKKRLTTAASPDIADALALTFSMPVHQKQDEDIFMQHSVKKEYNPYDFSY